MEPKRMSLFGARPKLSMFRDDSGGASDKFGAARNVMRARLRAEQTTVNQVVTESSGTRVSNVAFFAVLPVTLTVVVIIFCCIDQATFVTGGVDFDGLRFAFTDLTTDQSRAAVGSGARVQANLLGAIVSVTGFVLQLSINRFGPQVRTLFFGQIAPALYVAMIVSGVILNTVFTYMCSGPSTYVPRYSAMLGMFLVYLNMLAVWPYMSLLFQFLEPGKIIGHTRNACMRSFGFSNDAETDDAAMLNGLTEDKIEKRKLQLTKSSEYLYAVAHTALSRNERNVAHTALNAMLVVHSSYIHMKAMLPPGWFSVPAWMRHSVDFASLHLDYITSLEDTRTWFEFKIFKQYLLLFGSAIKDIKDICTIIAANTRVSAVNAAHAGDMAALDLSIKFFNSYLRTAINASDAKVATTVLHQYRMLAETLMSEDEFRTDAPPDGGAFDHIAGGRRRRGSPVTGVASSMAITVEEPVDDVVVTESMPGVPDGVYDESMNNVGQLGSPSSQRLHSMSGVWGKADGTAPLHRVSVSASSANVGNSLATKENDYGMAGTVRLRALRIAEHMVHYRNECVARKLHIIAEFVGYDLASLCEAAFLCNSQCHDPILDLTINPAHLKGWSFGVEELPKGILRAKIKLATAYMAMGANAHAREIRDMLGGESKDAVRTACDRLESTVNRDFWEVIDRNVNVDFVPEAQRKMLSVFLSWFK